MSCRIRRKKKNQVNEATGSTRTFNNYDINTGNYASTIKELYGPKVLKLCKSILGNFGKLPKKIRSSVELVSVDTKDNEIDPNAISITHEVTDTILDNSKLTEAIVSHLIDMTDYDISVSRKSIDIQTKAAIIPIKNGQSRHLNIDVKFINTGINNGHTNVETLQKYINAFNAADASDDFIEKFRKTCPDQLYNGQSQKDRNAIGDLLCFIQIKDNILTSCTFIPFICCIKIKTPHTLRNKGQNKITALQTPILLQTKDDIIKHMLSLTTIPETKT